MNDRHFATFHIAGFTYYNGVDVFENLKIGTNLTLHAEPENRHDPNAVVIYYEEKPIGYVPRDHNKLLSKFLNLGYLDLFETKINQLSPEAHPEHQVRVIVRIKEKE
jgi:hypothetical protein